MMRGRRLPPIDETAVLPANRSRSVSGKRPEPFSSACAAIFRFTEAHSMQGNPLSRFQEAESIDLAAFFRVRIPSASAFKVHNRPSPAV
jgi:hypothetical protein